MESWRWGPARPSPGQREARRAAAAPLRMWIRSCPSMRADCRLHAVSTTHRPHNQGTGSDDGTLGLSLGVGVDAWEARAPLDQVVGTSSPGLRARTSGKVSPTPRHSQRCRRRECWGQDQGLGDLPARVRGQGFHCLCIPKALPGLCVEARVGDSQQGLPGPRHGTGAWAPSLGKS